jgi:hypothetical protein
MRRAIAALAAAVLGATAAIAVMPPRDGGGAQAADDPAPTVLRVGDRVRVDGQPVGCRVARQDGRTVMDCRRAGALAGTYGTMLSSRQAMVVRYRNNSVAKVVFTATHRGASHRCQ